MEIKKIDYSSGESQIIAAIENLCHLTTLICCVDSAAIHQRKNGQWNCLAHVGNEVNNMSGCDEALTSRSAIFIENKLVETGMQGEGSRAVFLMCIPFEGSDYVFCVSHCGLSGSDEKQVNALIRLARQAELTINSNQKGNDLYKSFFEHLEEGIFQTTPDGHYIVANPKLASIYV